MLLIQLSDIHLVKDIKKNPVLDRIPQILKAIESLFIQDLELCLLVFSGDIAFSGNAEEYVLAEPFVQAIEQGLRNQFKAATHGTIFEPGNHDCNFTVDDQARQTLLDSLNANELTDDSIISILTSVQDSFFEFAKNMSRAPAVAQGSQRLFAQHAYTISGYTVQVNTLNTAWMSRKKEIAGSLQFPIQYLDSPTAIPAPNIVITALHHPYNWFTPESARQLRRLLEQSSDVILTGHEHEQETYTKTGIFGEQNEYTEGGVLQDSNNPNESSFTALLIDSTSQSQITYPFVWQGELYDALEFVDRPFIRNKARLRHEFDISPFFELFVNDPDALYAHPRKDPLLLQDVFLYPDLRQADKHDKSTSSQVVHGRDFVSYVLEKKHVLVFGAERAGKTALGKMLFQDLRRNAKIPLYINAAELKPGELKQTSRFLDAAVNRQYSPLVRAKYWQLHAEERAVVVDDYHKLPLSKSLRDQLLKDLAGC